VRQEVGAGMVVGNHSWDHPNWPPFARLGATRIGSEIRRADQGLRSMGTTPAFFRPPGGSFSPEVIGAAKDMDERVVLWDVDPRVGPQVEPGDRSFGACSGQSTLGRSSIST